MPQPIERYLSSISYPGRGILLGLAPGGGQAFIAYFIMGRSANSRNRVFVKAGGDIQTCPADPAKVEDPSLIIYTAAAREGKNVIVTNGAHTNVIREYLAKGGSFEKALRTLTFEPDPPHYTPRISGLLQPGAAGFSYKLSIIKALGTAPCRFFYEYPRPEAGIGHLIHTYAGNGPALPSFSGEPAALALPGTLSALGAAVWNALNKENRVALFVRSVTLEAVEEDRIYNRFETK